MGLDGRAAAEKGKTIGFAIAACFLSALGALAGCGNSVFLSPVPQLHPDAAFQPGNSGILYGQIQNQKRDNHILIGKLGAGPNGKHLLGDTAGLFAVRLSPGTYEFRLDAVGTGRGTSTYPCGMSMNTTCQGSGSLIPEAPYGLKNPALLALKVDAGKIYYVGSLFLTRTGIEVNWEKGEADSLMRAKYRGFDPSRAIENYPSRDSP